MKAKAMRDEVTGRLISVGVALVGLLLLFANLV
jgi:hypothetical protein